MIGTTDTTRFILASGVMGLVMSLFAIYLKPLIDRFFIALARSSQRGVVGLARRISSRYQRSEEARRTEFARKFAVLSKDREKLEAYRAIWQLEMHRNTLTLILYSTLLIMMIVSDITSDESSRATKFITIGAGIYWFATAIRSLYSAVNQYTLLAKVLHEHEWRTAKTGYTPTV